MQNQPNIDAKQALMTLRIMWAALLLGQLIFFVAIAFVLMPTMTAPPDLTVVTTLNYANLALLVMGAVVAHVLRLQIYKRNWRGHAVTPRGYITANIVYFAIWEGVSLLALVVTMLAVEYWPYIVPSAVAAVIHLINWPDGKPMTPSEPDLSPAP